MNLAPTASAAPAVQTVQTVQTGQTVQTVQTVQATAAGPSPTTRTWRVRTLLLVAAAAFVLYPALRPWGGEGDPQTFGSALWPLSHAFGMLGFASLAAALRAAETGSPWPWGGRVVRETASRMLLAAALLLPYYGAEAFGLHALGAHVAASGDSGALAVADDFRYAALPMTTFAVGLLLLVLVGGRLVHGLWAAGRTARTGAVLAGVGLASFLPQFFTPAPVRILHGVVLGVGLAVVALAGRRPA